MYDWIIKGILVSLLSEHMYRYEYIYLQKYISFVKKKVEGIVFMLASALMMNGLITARGEKELRNHKVGKVLYD